MKTDPLKDSSSSVDEGIIYLLGRRVYRFTTASYDNASERVRILLGLLRSELALGRSAPVSFRRRLWLWRRGYTSRSGVLFDLTDDNYERYISEYQEGLTHTINGNWTTAMGNKLTAHLLLSPFDSIQPKLHGILNNGTLKHFPPYNDVDKIMDRPESAISRDSNESRADTYLVNFLAEDGIAVLKPVFGSGGRGVMIVRFAEEEYRVNGDVMSRAEFTGLVRELNQYLVFEFIEQSKFMSELYPHASNTIRIVTMWDYERQEPFIAMTTVRIGTRQSTPLDNISQGGVLAGINIDTGEIVSVASIPKTSPFEVKWHEAHPNTGEILVGRSIPYWTDITENVVRMARSYPYLPYTAWDILPTPDGGFKVLEINSSPGIIHTQLHYRFLDDPRVRQFYKHHGVI